MYKRLRIGYPASTEWPHCILVCCRCAAADAALFSAVSCRIRRTVGLCHWRLRRDLAFGSIPCETPCRKGNTLGDTRLPGRRGPPAKQTTQSPGQRSSWRKGCPALHARCNLACNLPNHLFLTSQSARDNTPLPKQNRTHLPPKTDVAPTRSNRRVVGEGQACPLS